MSEQAEFDFPSEPKPLLPDPLTCVLSWREDGVKSDWPEMQIGAWFQSWAVALSCVLHPLNTNVRLKVRA